MTSERVASILRGKHSSEYPTDDWAYEWFKRFTGSKTPAEFENGGLVVKVSLEDWLRRHSYEFGLAEVWAETNRVLTRNTSSSGEQLYQFDLLFKQSAPTIITHDPPLVQVTLAATFMAQGAVVGHVRFHDVTTDIREETATDNARSYIATIANMVMVYHEFRYYP